MYWKDLVHLRLWDLPVVLSNALAKGKSNLLRRWVYWVPWGAATDRDHCLEELSAESGALRGDVGTVWGLGGLIRRVSLPSQRKGKFLVEVLGTRCIRTGVQ